jgi:hypothetical protein
MGEKVDFEMHPFLVVQGCGSGLTVWDGVRVGRAVKGRFTGAKGLFFAVIVGHEFQPDLLRGFLVFAIL